MRKFNAENEIAEKPEIKGGEFHLDWLTFTWKPERVEDINLSFFLFRQKFPEFDQIKDWVSIDKSWSHYSAGFRLNMDVAIHYDTNEGVQHKGVAVQIPAHALLYVFGLFKCKSVKAFLSMLKKRGAKVTRLDLAFDDYARIFEPSDFFEYNVNGYLKSRLSSTASLIGGSTFYLGKRTGQKYLRIYDKAVESKGLINAVRYEFEYKGKRAGEVAEMILADNVVDFPTICDDFFTLIYRDSTNISRCSVRDEWRTFCEKLLVSRNVGIPSMKESEKTHNYFAYLNRQVVKKLSVVYRLDKEGFAQYLDDVFERLDADQIMVYYNDLVIERDVYGYQLPFNVE